ncbi:MAG TPA: hypothetical protein VFQ84_07410 [Arenimonas sp.]|uniref:hypothetical protein n=1 Tax=Arenimonas sp. TaxID=1872635 RepID=UPI002D7E31CB|nr:hypothetical protein [Arenimonas sp.]HEU0153154.1 hypothetical protein [Arenimonas sp.]
MRIALPALQKKVLYLDQPFFSGAFRGGDPRFVELAARIERLSSQQLLISPRSFAHDAESLQWQRGTELLEFIKRTSRGLRFEQGYEVEQRQISKGFRAWRAGEPPEYVRDPRDALPRHVHRWHDYMVIDIRRQFDDPAELRERKERSAQTLVGYFDEWRQSTSTFEADVQAELDAVAKIYRDSYIQYLVQVGSGNVEAMLTSPIHSQVVERMRDQLPAEMDIAEQIEACAEFFRTPHFAQLPYQYIRSRACAMLKQRAKRGAYVNTDKAIAAVGGFFYDLDHIGHYAPYCDAIAMDQPMAEMMKSGQMDLEGRFGVKVFSLANLDEFHAWLDEAEQGMTDEHRQGLREAYG